jgi:serine protease AprX
VSLPALEEWLFGPPSRARFTQDSPILPDVWLRYGEEPGGRHDLLLTPHQHGTAAGLISALAERLPGPPAEPTPHRLAYNEGYVVARLSFEELITVALPLSQWWQERIEPILTERVDQPRGRSDLEWLATVVGWIWDEHERPSADEADATDPAARAELVRLGFDLIRQAEPPPHDAKRPLWSVNLNREARTALYRSRLAVKADAVERVFAADAGGLRWAIVDTGIDATHPAFRRRTVKGELKAAPEGGEHWANTRVLATYDFTRLRAIVAGESGDLDPDQREEVERRINLGRAIDWDALAPLLEIPHGRGYQPPGTANGTDHGTHIAGIVGGDWRAHDAGAVSEHDLIGICPTIELYDLRVFDAGGTGDEFVLLAALQFVRHLNDHSDQQAIHGANLSLSIGHDLKNYAVGRTPVCEECERLMGNGVITVAAAGNEGQARFQTAAGPTQDGFRTVAITDPGNAEEVLTVGSTHRSDPHTYGVSYFSSRGPTGDGRVKPDLVAPGEKVEAPAPGGISQVMDGTSQATAHVSGVAALLMAQHSELIGRPGEVKRILCETATDLGRERCFQGAGMIDALRALQEV